MAMWCFVTVLAGFGLAHGAGCRERSSSCSRVMHEATQATIRVILTRLLVVRSLAPSQSGYQRKWLAASRNLPDRRTFLCLKTSGHPLDNHQDQLQTSASSLFPLRPSSITHLHLSSPTVAFSAVATLRAIKLLVVCPFSVASAFLLRHLT